MSGSTESSPPGGDLWDVVILGGALAGSSAALLLLEQRPELRILLLERSEAFGRRVGEATVEISGYFLGRVLGLTQHLNQEHLVKQGMRFWFHNAKTRDLGDCGEIGTRYLVRLPAYQVDRAVLDQEVYRRAVAAGAVAWRPAVATATRLIPGGEQTVTVRRDGRTEEVRTRWIIDASGSAASMAREHDWFVPNRRHPTSAAWARWKGVADWDGPELARRHPEWSAACAGIRGTATNHFMGDGWWAWCIPLKGGDYSIGVVFDERRVDWPADGTVGARLRRFLEQHPAARELLRNAAVKDGDVHWRRHLAYHSRVIAGNGFVLVGDAAGFLDPFYSPGMDWLSFTTVAGVDLVLAGLAGKPVEAAAARHSATFVDSYRRWFEGVYEGKYAYFGDYELMRLAFVLDLGLYYLGVVSQPFKRGRTALGTPVFATPPSIPVFHLMRLYNRRIAAIADARRRRGVFGRNNHSRRYLFPGFTLEPKSALPIVGALARWLLLEVREGWRSWGRRSSSIAQDGPVVAAANGRAGGVPAAPKAA